MKLISAAFAALSIGVLSAAPVRAADPLPVPCTGVTITDAAGDQIVYPNPVLGLGPTATKGADTLDARAVFFNYVTKDGKSSLTANIRLTEAKPDLPPDGADTGSVEYFLDFAPAVGDVSWLRATTNGTAFKFEYGKVNRAPNGASTVTTATAGTGRLFPGRDGILQMDVPLDVTGAKLGTKFEGIALSISPTGYAPADDAPDDGVKEYTVTECPAEAPATPSDTPPAPAPVEPTQPQQTPVQQTPGEQPSQQPSQPAQPTKQPAAKKKKKKPSCAAKAKKKFKGKKNAKKRAKALKACKKKGKKKRS